jgi:uncharacterized membrane protein
MISGIATGMLSTVIPLVAVGFTIIIAFELASFYGVALAGVGLLVGVYPANVQMAVDAMAGDKPAWKALTLARLPLQWPMIRAMWRTARG